MSQSKSVLLKDANYLFSSPVIYAPYSHPFLMFHSFDRWNVSQKYGKIGV